jgi:hypothetical protein
LIYYSPNNGGKIDSLSSNAVPYDSLLRYSQDKPLVSLLGNLTFKNYGVVKSSDRYTWQKIPCMYLESQNVSGPYLSWADRSYANYLYHNVSGDLVHPPSGMRSSVPLGGEVSSACHNSIWTVCDNFYCGIGISAGNIELRGDGTIHEWSIFNQYPAGAAKIQIIDDVFMGVRAAVQGQEPVSLVLQTHPSNQQLPAVEALSYRGKLTVTMCMCQCKYYVPAFSPTSGAYPVSKLSVIDNRLPVHVDVYAYSRFKHNNMNQSATPAVAFTAVIKNHLNENVTASFMFNLPLGLEPHTQRMARQMSQNVSTSSNPDYLSAKAQTSSIPLECFMECNSNDSCKSWSFDDVSKTCYVFDEVYLNGHHDNSFAGVKVSNEIHVFILAYKAWRYNHSFLKIKA